MILDIEYRESDLAIPRASNKRQSRSHVREQRKEIGADARNTAKTAVCIQPQAKKRAEEEAKRKLEDLWWFVMDFGDNFGSWKLLRMFRLNFKPFRCWIAAHVLIRAACAAQELERQAAEAAAAEAAAAAAAEKEAADAAAAADGQAGFSWILDTRDIPCRAAMHFWSLTFASSTWNMFKLLLSSWSVSQYQHMRKEERLQNRSSPRNSKIRKGKEGRPAQEVCWRHGKP